MKQSCIFYAFYDLSLAPVTFDIASFLFMAEHARKKTKCKYLHLVIVPGPENGFRAKQFGNYQRAGADNYQFDVMHWRLSNIVVPCGWLLPSCRKVSVCSCREEAIAIERELAIYSFPDGYRVTSPVKCYETCDLVAFATQEKYFSSSVLPSLQALTYADRWLDVHVGDRKLVTITLRECDYELSRNSNLEQWAAFAKGLPREKYFPVFLRDMDRVFTPLPSVLRGITFFPEAVWNIELRAALYARSYLNMMVANGPGTLSLYNRYARLLVFHKKDACGAASYHYASSQGLFPGDQYGFMSPFQRLIWDDDTLSVLNSSFVEMSDQIDSIMRADLMQAAKLAEELLAQGNFAGAEWLTSMAVERFDQDPDSWLLRSKIFRLGGYYSEALGAVNQAAQIAETSQGLDELQAIARGMGREHEANSIAAYRQRVYF